MAILRRIFNMVGMLSLFALVIASLFAVTYEYGAVPIILFIFFITWLQSNPPASSSTLGSARLADFIDVVLSGLMHESRGVLLGKAKKLKAPNFRDQLAALFLLPISLSRQAIEINTSSSGKGRWLRLPEQAGVHMAYIAPTGRGKSAGNVISNLLTDPSSAVVMDFKGELLAKTAYTRMSKFGHQVVCVAPFGLPPGINFPISPFNPLQLIDANSSTFHDDAAAIANALIIHTPNNNQPFFDQSAEALVHILATALIIEASAAECTLGELRSIIASPEKLQLVEDIMRNSASDHSELLERLAGLIRSLQGKTRTDVIATANTHLRWLDSPAIRKSLGEMDFKLNNLLGDGCGMTIYFHVPVDKLHDYRGYIRAVFSSLVKAIFRAGESKTRRIGFYLDESYGLGPRLESLYAAMIYGRSYGIHLNFYFQSISQIEELFEGPRAKAFLSNVRPVFTSIEDYDTAKSVSAWIGRTTVEARSRQWGLNMGKSKQFQERGGYGWSKSYGYSANFSRQQQAREVLQPEEILQLPLGTSIIPLPHMRPILAEPIFYFQDRRLAKLARESEAFVRGLTPKPSGFFGRFRRRRMSEVAPPAIPQSPAVHKDSEQAD